MILQPTLSVPSLIPSICLRSLQVMSSRSEDVAQVLFVRAIAAIIAVASTLVAIGSVSRSRLGRRWWRGCWRWGRSSITPAMIMCISVRALEAKRRLWVGYQRQEVELTSFRSHHSCHHIFRTLHEPRYRLRPQVPQWGPQGPEAGWRGVRWRASWRSSRFLADCCVKV